MKSSSTTARTVLQGVWLTACDPRTSSQVSPDLAEFTRIAMTQLMGEQRTNRFRAAPIRSLMRAIERLMLPGVCSHYVARKNVIFAIARDASIKQLVVLGGGFDGLAWRIASARPDCRCIEVDHPMTQIDKRAVLAAAGGRPVELIPCDLGDVAAIGRTLGDLPQQPTLFVAEGLLMYLPPHAVRAILSTIAQRGDRAVVSFMSLNSNGQPTFTARQGIVRRFLSRVGEPFTWGLPPENAEAYFNEIGLRLETLHGAPVHATVNRVQPGMIPGEWLAYLSAEPHPHL